MEEHLGRELLTMEIIHHINGDPFDNRFENLYLCKNQQEHMDLHKQMEKGVKCQD